MFKFFFILFITGLFTSNSILAQKRLTINWNIATSLPPVDSLIINPGVAGAFIGITDNVLIIAGGANFPTGLPWEGGKKKYQDQIYVLEITGKETFKWEGNNKFRLQQPIAYGSSVSSPVGIICIGGENENGILSNVFSIRWKDADKAIQLTDLPSLPFPLTNLSVTTYGNKLYVAGGETNNGVSDKFLSLDLDNLAAGWKQLPALPKPISHAIMIVLRTKNKYTFYLIGGRKKTNSGISELYNSVYEFDPDKNVWKQRQSLPYALSAGSGIVTAAGNILLFGGDKGDTFHKTEQLLAVISRETNEAKKRKLIQQKNKLQASHPGFSKEVLCYDPDNDKWSKLENIPFQVGVTTTAVAWKDFIIIPCGEIKAGVRTPQILIGKLQMQ